MESDIRQIIAAARDLVRRCDQGRAAWLNQLTQPLPPRLRDDAEQATYAFHALIGFDPFDGLRRCLTVATADRPADRRASGHHHSGKLPLEAGGDRRPVIPFDARPSKAVRAAGGKAAKSGSSTLPEPAPASPQHLHEIGLRKQRITGDSDASASVKASSPAHRPDNSPQARYAHAAHDARSVDDASKPQAPVESAGPLSRQAPTRSTADIIAAKRRARGNKRDLVSTCSPTRRRQSKGSEQRPDTATPPKPAAASSPASGNGLGSALLAEAVAAARRGLTQASEAGAAPPGENQAGQTATGDPRIVPRPRSNGPVRIEEPEVETAAPTAPTGTPEPAPAAPAEDLARLLADAAYLHGIDLT